MRSRYAVTGALGAVLVTVFAVLGPPAAASANPCGAGYTLRITVPIDTANMLTGKVRTRRVQPIGTIKGYSLGDTKCAFLSINPTWKRIHEIANLRMGLSWWSDSMGKAQSKGLAAGPKDWKGRNPLIGPSVGPLKVTVQSKYKRAHVLGYVELWAKDVDYYDGLNDNMNGFF